MFGSIFLQQISVAERTFIRDAKAWRAVPSKLTKFMQINSSFYMASKHFSCETKLS